MSMKSPRYESSLKEDLVSNTGVGTDDESTIKINEAYASTAPRYVI